jgi:NitT/TauT family transport system substrate-binding protein
MKHTAIIVLILLSLLPAARAAQGVNVGIMGTVDDLVFIMAKDKGYFAAEGLTVQFVPIRTGGAAMISALAAGTVDAARSALVFPSNEVFKAAGLKVVADNQHTEKGAPAPGYYLVRWDLAAKVRSYADLKGLRVATPSAGTVQYVKLLLNLEAAGLKESDMLVRSNPLNLRPMLLASKELDVAYVLEPQAGMLAASGVAVPFAGSELAEETAPRTQLLFGRKLMKDRARALGFMKAYLRAARDYNAMKPEELPALALKLWGDAEAAASLKSLFIFSDGRIDTGYIMQMQDQAVKRGFTKVRLAEKELFDMSFAQEASRILDSAAGK